MPNRWYWFCSDLETGDLGAHDGHVVEVGSFRKFDDSDEFAMPIDSPIANERRAGRELDAVVTVRGSAHVPDHVDVSSHVAVARDHARAESDFVWHN